MKARVKIYVSQGRVAASTCPSCARELDAVTGLSTDRFVKPKPGDLTLCLYCGTFLTFNWKLKLECANYEQIASVDSDMRALAELSARQYRESH